MRQVACLLLPVLAQEDIDLSWVRFNVPPSDQAHYTSYRGRVFILVKWHNQQCQSTEGRGTDWRQWNVQKLDRIYGAFSHCVYKLRPNTVRGIQKIVLLSLPFDWAVIRSPQVYASQSCLLSKIRTEQWSSVLCRSWRHVRTPACHIQRAPARSHERRNTHSRRRQTNRRTSDLLTFQ